MNVITISGQYGSNGDKIAAHLAGRLHWRLVGDNIKRLVANELDLPEEEVETHDQHAYGFIDRCLITMAANTIDMCPDMAHVTLSFKTQEQLYREKQQKIIEDVAGTGEAVIIGRGSQVILADQPDVLHIRIVAPLAQRVYYVMQREQISEAHAHSLIKQKDHRLAYYHKLVYGRSVDDHQLYDLVINSQTLNLESQLDLICLALQNSLVEQTEFMRSHIF
ncbi:MAG: cytidylate kinase-like family protein [Ktedonobacteraceae bacterium]|nr:cytidylate kinase-like family protein [Ktedonobacteraceae bacterium]